MRRTIGLVLIGLGVFALVVSPLARFYVYPQVAVAPADQDSVSVLVGENANVFDVGSLENITTDLTTTASTVGDVEAAEQSEDEGRDGVVVWVNTSSTKDSDDVVRSRSIDRVAFDEFTGEAVNCCGEFYSAVEGEQEAVEHEGLVFKFPFETQKKTYDFWDSTLLETRPAEFSGVEGVEGITTYKFVQEIEPSLTETSEVPAAVLGLDQEGNVEADRMYSNVRTMWVEPRTGVIIKRTEEQYNTIRYDGEDRLVTTAVNTGYDEATIKGNADKYGPLASQLNLLRNVVPLAALIAGVLLVLIGVVLARRPSGRRSA